VGKGTPSVYFTNRTLCKLLSFFTIISILYIAITACSHRCSRLIMSKPVIIAIVVVDCRRSEDNMSFRFGILIRSQYKYRLQNNV